MIDGVLSRVNEIYAARKGKQHYLDKPKVQSDQVLALMEALVEEIDTLTDRVAVLEAHHEVTRLGDRLD